MIVYHGTPMCGKRHEIALWMKQKDVLIPWLRKDDLAIAAETARSFVFDCSAFSAWKKGNPITDWSPYAEWCTEWSYHPAFQWAIIPDVIEGSEGENDDLIAWWMSEVDTLRIPSVPVYHLHESLDRLVRLVENHAYIALGSSGEWRTPGAATWHSRMRQIFDIIAPNGQMQCRVHGLRMAAPKVQAVYPFASVDSTNVSQNTNRCDEKVPTPEGEEREKVNYWWNRVLKADRIETCEKATSWQPAPVYMEEF